MGLLNSLDVLSTWFVALCLDVEHGKGVGCYKSCSAGLLWYGL